MPEMADGGETALILSGGGANGAYEVGVLRALLGGACPSTNFTPLRPGIISGTSIGAFNAATLVSQWFDSGLAALAQLEHIWRIIIPRDDSTNHNHIYRVRGDPFEFLSLNLLLTRPFLPFKALAEDTGSFVQNSLATAAAMFDAEGTILSRLAGLVNFSSLITNEPAGRLIDQVIDPRLLRESPIQLRIAATNWDTGVVRVFQNYDMTDDYARQYILASTAIPGVFPPVVIDGDSFVDGGLVMNTPLLPALRAGAETIHVIYLDPAVKAIPISALQSSLDTMTRMFMIQLASKLNEDIKRAAQVNRAISTLEKVTADHAVAPAVMKELERAAGIHSLRKVAIHRYHPRDDLGSGLLGWLDFSTGRISRLIERGFQDAVSHDCRRSGCVTRDGEVMQPPSDTLDVAQ
jgi:NTE family protein